MKRKRKHKWEKKNEFIKSLENVLATEQISFSQRHKGRRQIAVSAIKIRKFNVENVHNNLHK